MAKISQLAAVSFLSRIYLFGGANYEVGNMHEFSEEGEFLRDLSSDPLIPAGMCKGTYAVQKRKMYAVGWRSLNGDFKW